MGSDGRSRRRATTGLTGLVLAGLLAAQPAATQVRQLAEDCGFGGLSGPVCGPVALAAQAVQGGVGLAASGGNAFQGSGSTLGRRYGATPRIGISGGLGFNRFKVPDYQPGGADAGVFAPSVHAQVTVGVLNGFSLAPTLGGFLSLDVLAGLDAVFLPSSAGFQGNTTAWKYGVRVGILRESFTLPGLTLSVTRNHAGTVEFVPGGGSSGRVALDVTTTAWRAVVGKDLAGLGFTVGAGWDDYDSDGELTPLAVTVPPVPFDGFGSDRAVFFAGVSRTFLVLQLSGELGWARGFSVDGDLPTAFDPGSGSLFGAVALRLTL